MEERSKWMEGTSRMLEDVIPEKFLLWLLSFGEGVHEGSLVSDLAIQRCLHTSI